jgi:NADPH-dependent 2,4-dienoyl-CoA reductase/sulfur reductase-like enzyme
VELKDVDVAVIGAGPAGLAAAIRAREAGARDVIVMERAEQMGGLLHQCVHNGFGLFYFNEDLTGPEYAHRFVEKAMDVGVKGLLETMVTEITPGRQIKAVNKEAGYITFKPKAIVLAMGCRERARGALGIPGTRPAGIFTAGTAQRFVNVEGFLPGKRAVILGSGDIGMIMARRLTLEGAKVEAVVEILPYTGGLIRNEVQCLHDFDIPVLLKHTVARIHGEQRVEAVTIAEVDDNNSPIAGTERVIDCDTLLLSVGLIPENELSLMAGVQIDPITGGPVVDEIRQTSVSGIFAGGNVVHVHDLVDNVSSESELAGESAARFASGSKGIKEKIRLKAGDNIRYIVPQTISGKNEVTLYMRVSEMEENVRLQIGDVMSRGLRVVKPSEMLKIELSPEQLKKIKPGTTEIVVNCEKRESKQ